MGFRKFITGNLGSIAGTVIAGGLIVAVALSGGDKKKERKDFENGIHDIYIRGLGNCSLCDFDNDGLVDGIVQKFDVAHERWVYVAPGYEKVLGNRVRSYTKIMSEEIRSAASDIGRRTDDLGYLISQDRAEK